MTNETSLLTILFASYTVLEDCQMGPVLQKFAVHRHTTHSRHEDNIKL